MCQLSMLSVALAFIMELRGALTWTFETFIFDPILETVRDAKGNWWRVTIK